MSRKRNRSRTGAAREITREAGEVRPSLDAASRVHPRWPMRILWLALLAVVIGFVVTALPQTKLGGYHLSRGERRRIEEAERMEAQNLPRAAAAAYTQLTEGKRVSDQARSLACERLADIYAEKLKDPRRAVESVERALFHARRAEERARLGKRVDELRARFEAQLTPADSDPLKSEDKGPAIAEIGSRKIGLDELLFAWSRAGKGEAPTDDTKLHEFTVSYLNDALYAEEARRRGLDRRTGFKLETRLQAQKLLAAAVMTEAMGEITEDALKQYYEEHKNESLRPAHVRLGHIVVEGAEAGAEVGRRLAAGEAFEAVAASASLDAATLDNHIEIGWVSENENFVPYVGAIEGLARRMAAYDDGATTGPITSPRGVHYFKALQKQAREPEPFEKIKDQLTKRLRAERSRKAQEELLKRLRDTIPTKIHENAIKTAMEMLRQRAALGADKSAKPAAAKPAPVPPAPKPPEPTGAADSAPGGGS